VGRIWQVGALAAVFTIGCAENKLRTYMVVQTSIAPEKQDKKKGEIQLSPTPLLLTMTSPDADDLENLAEDLKLSSPQKYHRLPPLTFLRFDFENKTALPWKLNLMQCYFSDPKGRSFRPLGSRDYADRYTSVAYEHFRYDAMYAAYITKHGKEVPKESFWFEKQAPGEAIELKRDDSGFQVIPFEFIPAGTEDLILHYPAEDTGLRQMRIRLVTERGA